MKALVNKLSYQLLFCICKIVDRDPYNYIGEDCPSLFTEISVNSPYTQEYIVNIGDRLFALNIDALDDYLLERSIINVKSAAIHLACAIFCQEVVEKPSDESHTDDLPDFESINWDDMKAGLNIQLPKYMYDSLCLPDPDVISNISHRPYEGKPCKGRIAFTAIDVPVFLQYAPPILLDEEHARHARKILESIGENQSLIALRVPLENIKDDTKIIQDSQVSREEYAWQIVGIAHSSDVNGFSVEFEGQSAWSLYFKIDDIRHCVFQQRFGKYSFSHGSGLDEGRFTEAISWAPESKRKKLLSI